MDKYTRISGGQLVALLISVVGATAIVYAPPTSIEKAGQNAWLSLLVPATVYGLLVVYVTTKLARRFAGMPFQEYTKELLGIWPARLVWLLYLLYFFLMLTVIIREFANVLNTAFMPDTPIVLFGLALIFLAFYGALGGIEVICRANQFILPILLGTMTIMLLFLIKDVELARLLPIMEEGPGQVIKGAKVASAFRGEVFILLWLVHHLKQPEESTGKGMQAVIILGFLLMLDAAAVISVFGKELASREAFPTLFLARYINASYFLNRVEGIAMLVWVTGVVVKTGTFLYIALDISKMLFGVKENKWYLLLPVGVFLLAGALYGFENDLQVIWFLQSVFPPVSWVFQLLLPCLLLGIAWLRKKGRMVMVKKVCLVLLLVFLLFSSGCWSKREIEKLAIVSAVGIDRVELEQGPAWQVTMELFHPQALVPTEGGGGGSQSAAWVATSLGNTIEEAINSFSSRVSRLLYFSHTDLIIVGKDAVQKENLADLLSAFFSAKEARLRSWVLIADGKAQDVLMAGAELEQYISAELGGMILETRNQLSRAEVANMKDVGEALAFPGKDVITGKVEIFVANENPLEGHAGKEETEMTSVRIHGSGVFSNGKLAGWFSDREARGYLFIVGKAKSTVIPVKLDNEEYDASVQIIGAKSSIKPEIDRDMAKIKVEIQAEGYLAELYPGEERVSQKFFALVEEKVAEELKKEAEMAVARAQEYRADVFGFGEALYRRYPQYWRQVEEQWRDYFVNLPVEIDVTVAVRRTGVFLEPVPSR